MTFSPATTNSAASIARTFAALRQNRRIALMPFVPGGYPDLQTTAAILPALAEGGASLVEVGFPFSDPIADGPTIQEAFSETLARKVRTADVLSTVASVRSAVSIPLVAMISYSLVYRYGLQRFVRDAKAAGIDGMILPDLPPPEAESVCDVIRTGGLDTVLLVAPTTPEARRREIARLSSGFIYYLSVSGITGERDRLPPDVESNVRSLKQLTDKPVCVGFGIHRPEQVRQLRDVADGAIVGSALVRRMKERRDDGPAAIAATAAAYCRELLSKV